MFCFEMRSSQGLEEHRSLELLLRLFSESTVSWPAVTRGEMFLLPLTAEAEGVRMSGCREFKPLVQSILSPTQTIESSGRALLKLCQ